MKLETTYSRPCKAKLYVHLDTGGDCEVWEVTPEDLDKFGLISRYEAYSAFEQVWSRVLRDSKMVGKDITDAQLNPIRYLVETVLCHPSLLDHPEHEGWAAIAELERRLRIEKSRKVDTSNCD